MKTTNKVNPLDELVEVRLFKDNNKYADDVFVGLNGRGILIKRGEPVMIKRKYAEILALQELQDNKTARLISEETSRG